MLPSGVIGTLAVKTEIADGSETTTGISTVSAEIIRIFRRRFRCSFWDPDRIFPRSLLALARLRFLESPMKNPICATQIFAKAASNLASSFRLR